MFMEIAITGIGIGLVVMIGYLVISQVNVALSPASVKAQVANPCKGHLLNDTTYCNMSTYSDSTYGSIPGPLSDNTSTMISIPNSQLSTGMSGVQVTIFAGLGLIAVGIIVTAAFGLINIFK